MKLNLEFIQRRRLPVFGLAFLLAALVTASMQLNWLGQVRAENQQKLDEVARIERLVRARERAVALAAIATPEQEQRNREQKRMLDSLRYSWNRVLAEIEQNDQKDVAIGSLSHSQNGEVTQLSVEAADVDALVRYVNRLNGDDDEVRWYIASHQVQLQKSPQTVKGEIIRK